MLEESSSTKAYFGALSFTKPVENLVPHTVSLRVLLDWLSKPKGPHLVEAAGGANPEKALTIVVTRQMLYESETPLVGVGLVYKPHYISMEPFSAAYMHLNEWHMAGSLMESEDSVTSSRLLYTASDLILPLIQVQLWQRHEAKQAALHLEEGLEGAEVSPTEESAPGKSLPVEAEDNGEASSRQRVIDTTQQILKRIHAIRLQALYEMGSTHELDQTLARALMAKFTRVQLIIGQDLTKSLIAL